MAAEHYNGPQGEYCTGSVALEDAVALSNQVFNDPKAFEEVSQYIDALEASGSPLYTTIAEGAREISAMLATQYPLDSIHNNPGNAAADTSFESIPNSMSPAYLDGRPSYQCLKCGKLYDRRDRAESCENVKLGLRPYECKGSCGTEGCTKAYASKGLLTRHCGPDSDRVVECLQCRARVKKHSFSRHLKSCMKRSQS